MNELLFEQLKETAHQLGWVILRIIDEDNTTVAISMGEEPWLDELFGDVFSD